MDWLTDLFARYYALVERDGGFALLLGLYLAFMLTERAAYLFARPGTYENRDAWNNVVMAALAPLFEAFVTGAFVFVAYMFVYDQLALWHLPNAWWAFLLAFVLWDFCYWLDHYVSHKNGFFWMFHQVHHSSREMNLTVAPRGSWLLKWVQPAYFLMPLLGVSIVQTAAVALVGSLWGIFNHTRLVGRMGALDRWLCTPANHRVHHGTQAKYLDRNYGQTLLIWDRLFGTWQPEEEEPVYGLVRQLEDQTVLRIQTAPFAAMWRTLRAAPDWRARLGYLWHPPGWSHDGQHARSREMRAAAGLAAQPSR